MVSSRVCGPHHEYYGIDIDQTCAKMTALNLFLSGLFTSETMCGNALIHKDFRFSYVSSFLPFGIFRIQEKERSRLWKILDSTLQEKSKDMPPPPDLNPNKYPEGSQLTFF
jgi:hypothetical protein